MVYYEVSSTNDMVYREDTSWLSQVRGKFICEICGNLLPPAKSNGALPVWIRAEMPPDEAVLCVNYRVVANIIRKDLLDSLSFWINIFYMSDVYINGNKSNEYRAITVPDEFRVKKDTSDWATISCCSKCGRQMGGAVDWVFEYRNGQIPIISNDYGSGLFLAESVLNTLSANTLNQISLLPRKMQDREPGN